MMRKRRGRAGRTGAVSAISSPASHVGEPDSDHRHGSGADDPGRYRTIS